MFQDDILVSCRERMLPKTTDQRLLSAQKLKCLGSSLVQAGHRVMQDSSIKKLRQHFLKV